MTDNRVGETYFAIILESFQREFRCPSDKGSGPNSNSHTGCESLLVASAAPCRQPSFWKWHSCCNPYDYRWMAGLYFVLRSSMVLSALADSAVCLLLQQVICIGMALVIIIAQPYRNGWNNKLDSFIFLLMVVVNGITIYQYYLTLIENPLSKLAFSFQYVLIYIPFLWISIYVVATVLQAWDKRKCHSERPVSERTSVPVDPAVNEEEASLRQARNSRDASTQDSRHLLQMGSTRDAELAPLLEPNDTDSDSSSD